MMRLLSVFEEYKCKEGYVKCADGIQCIHEQNMCDSPDSISCNDGSDENDQKCKGEVLHLLSFLID